MALDRMIDIGTLKDLEEIRVILCAAGMTDLEYRIRTMIHYAGYDELVGNGKNEGLEPEDELTNRKGDSFVFMVLMENVDDYLSDIQQLSEVNKKRMDYLSELCTKRAKADERAVRIEYERGLL